MGLMVRVNAFVGEPASGGLGAYSVASDTIEGVLSSLVSDFGHEKAKAFHTDRALELLATVRELPGSIGREPQGFPIRTGELRLG